MAWNAPQSPFVQPQVYPLHPPPSTVIQLPNAYALNASIPPAIVPCLRAKDIIDNALQISFNDLFEWGEDVTGKTMLDRRALLLYHPEDHVEDLEIITRWLLMHHVEVSNPWYDGCWDHFRQQIAKGGSGIVMVGQHPSIVTVRIANIPRHTPTSSIILSSQVSVKYFGSKSAYGR